MKYAKSIMALVAVGVSALVTSCEDSKSYAELLADENKATNLFLVNQRVEMSIPADTVFETGINAPYYQLDEEGNVFMQVLDPGTPGNKVEYDELIYFRFMRYSLYNYIWDGKTPNTSGYYGSFTEGDGNDNNMTTVNTSFRFGNTSSQSSTQWGDGIQMPLIFLPIDCNVNIVIKSQYGLTSEQGNVIPYLYSIRYFKPQT